MGLCFGERQRLKGEAHTPRGDTSSHRFKELRNEKWREQKLLVSERKKDIIFTKRMEQPHTTDEKQTQ